MRETWRNGSGLVLVWVCVYCGCAHMLRVEMGWITYRVWMAAQEERVRKGKEFGKEGKRREKKGKSGLREKSVFLLLRDCVFHSILSPLFQSTMPPLFFLHTHTTPHHTIAHYSIAHTAHHTTCLCVVLFLSVCDCQCTHFTLNQTTQHHAIMQSPQYTTNGWYNEWMGKSSGD